MRAPPPTHANAVIQVDPTGSVLCVPSSNFNARHVACFPKVGARRRQSRFIKQILKQPFHLLYETQKIYEERFILKKKKKKEKKSIALDIHFMLSQLRLDLIIVHLTIHFGLFLVARHRRNANDGSRAAAIFVNSLQ